MSDDTQDSELKSWSDPELEARVVAWVLGEASAFEIAELERVLGEKPELAVFKRRIEAVHGLVGAAMKMELDPMRMEEGRRRKLLERLGGKVQEPAAAEKVVAMPRRAAGRKYGGLKWVAGIAACLVLVALIAGFHPAKNASPVAAMRELQVQEQERVQQAQQAQQQRVLSQGPAEGPYPLAALDALKAQMAQVSKRSDDREQLAMEMNSPDASDAVMALKGNGSAAAGSSKAANPHSSVAEFNLGKTRTFAEPSSHDAREPEEFDYNPDAASSMARNSTLSLGASAPLAVRAAAPLSPYAAPVAPASVDATKDMAMAGANTYTGNTLVSSGRVVMGGVAGTEHTGAAQMQVQARGYLTAATSAASASAVDRDAEAGGVVTKAMPKQSGGGMDAAPPASGLDAGSVAAGAAAPAGSESKSNEPEVNDQQEQDANEAYLEPRAELNGKLDLGSKAPVHRVAADKTYSFDAKAPANAGADAVTAERNRTIIPKIEEALALLSKETVDRDEVRLATPSVNTEELVTSTFQVPADFLHRPARFTKVDDDWRPAPDEPIVVAANYLASLGVQFPPGATAFYFPRSGRLIVHDTPGNLDLLNTIGNEAPKATPTPVPQAEVNTAERPYSTFSLHVSDVSFLLAKAALDRGQMPDAGSIREEEFYNAFDYGDPAPAAGEKIACHIEQAAHPLLQQRNLVRIAMKVAATGRGAGQPLQLTVLLDTSGSMKRADRAASVQRAMEVLASLMGPNDAVTLIGFAREPRLIAEEAPGNEAGKLADMVKRIPPDGGTNMEEALKTASELAVRHFKPGAQNRVVMLTDGAANLGDADPEKLAKIVDGLRQKGVSFDACGVGAEGLNDDVLEALTRKGGGRYYFLNTPEDADAGFARQLAGAFRPAAENVKMQVRFNPDRVGNYRLIGFEKHRLNQEDFRNDKVTAAQLAAEEAAVALYQVQVKPEGSGEIGEVFVRYHDPADGRMVENSWTIPYDAQAPALDKAAPSMQLAATAALLAEKLRGGPTGDQVDLNALEPVVAKVRGEYADQARVQDLAGMFEKVREMTGK